MGIFRLQRELIDLVNLLSTGDDGEFVEKRALEIVNELQSAINDPILLSREQYVTILDCVILSDSRGDEEVIDHRTRIKNVVLLRIEKAIRGIGGKTSYELERESSISSGDELQNALLQSIDIIFDDHSQNIDKTVQDAVQQSTTRILRSEVPELDGRLRNVQERISNGVAQSYIQQSRNLIKQSNFAPDNNILSLKSKVQESIKEILQDEMKKFDDKHFHAILRNVERKLLDEVPGDIMKNENAIKAVEELNSDIMSLIEIFNPNVAGYQERRRAILQEDPALIKFIQDLYINKPSDFFSIDYEVTKQTFNEVFLSVRDQNVKMVQSPIQRNIEVILDDCNEQERRLLHGLCQRFLNEIPENFVSVLHDTFTKNIERVFNRESEQLLDAKSKVTEEIERIMQDEEQQNLELSETLRNIGWRFTHDIGESVNEVADKINTTTQKKLINATQENLLERMRSEMKAVQQNVDVNSASTSLENMTIKPRIQKEREVEVPVVKEVVNRKMDSKVKAIVKKFEQNQVKECADMQPAKSKDIMVAQSGIDVKRNPLMNLVMKQCNHKPCKNSSLTHVNVKQLAAQFESYGKNS